MEIFSLFGSILLKDNDTKNKLKDIDSTAQKTGNTFDSVFDKIGKGATAAAEKLDKISEGAINAGKKLTLGITTPLIGIATAAVKVGNDFETSMSQAAGALEKPMSQMGSLRELALKTGQDTQFSATQAANAITELAKGGLTEAQIKGGALKATMDLAASSGMQLGVAANTVVQAMGAFGISADHSAQAVNALAGAAAASSTDVQPLSEGLAQCAAQAHLAGWSIQDTTAVLGAFADAGVVGSDAGTSLKTMLQRLGAPTDDAATKMKSLGINVWDGSGHMKNAAGIAQELQTHMSGLSDAQKQAAMNTIFGSDATRAASILMNDGVKGLEKYTKATNDQSAAARLAASQQGDTSKSIEQMFGALETAGIKMQQALAPIIISVANTVGNLATSFSKLSPTAQKVILIFGGIAAAVGPLLLIIGGFLSAIGTVTGAIAVLSTGAAAATPAVAGLASVFGLLSGIFTKVPKVSAAGMFTGLTTGLSAAGSAISKFIFGPWLLLGNGLKALPNTIKNLNFASIITKIIAPFKSIPTIITGAFSKIPGLFTSLKTVFTSFGTTIIALGPKILTGIRSMFSIQGIMTGARAALALFTGPWGALILAIMAGVGAIIANWSKISAFAQKIFGGDTTQILTAFKTFFMQIWEDIKNNLTAAWNYISPTITNAVKEIQTFWNEVWPQIKQVFVEVWDVMKVLLAPAMAAMYTAISAGIGLIKGIWGPAWNLLKDTLKTAWDLMRDVIKTAWDLISGIIKVGLDILTGNWGKAWTDMKSIFSNLWSDIKKLFSDMANDAITWGKDLVDGLIKGIKGMIGGVEDAVKNIAEKIKSYIHFSRPDEGPLRDYETWMPDFLQGLANGINSNKGIITKAMQGLTNSMSLGSGNNNQAQYGQNLNESLGEGIQDSQDKVTKPVDNLSNTITTKIATLVQSFIQHGQNTDLNLGTGITTNSDATLTPVNTLITTITTGIKTFVQSCIGHGQDTDKNLGTGINNSSNEVINAANAVTTTVGNNLDTFAKGSIKYGQETDNSIASGVTGTVNTVTSAANSLTTAIGNILKTFASSCVSIGQSIGNSIASGMQASEANAVSIAHELTQKIIDAFTGPDGFDIHSPSRRLFEIGSYVIQGFINGLSSQDVLTFFQNKIGSMLSVAGDVSKWLSMTLMITGTPMDWLPGLLKLASYESGDPGTLGSGDPTLVNSVGVGGEYATGLLQMLPSTFSENMLGGFNNIMNPIDNAIAAIRYIKNRYGSVYNTPLFTSGGAYQGYEKGTDNATEGPHPVAENGLEIVLGKALRWFSGGETVLNNSDSMALLDNIKNAVETVKSLGSMSFGSFPVVKTKETKTTENKNTKVEKQPIILKLILQNGKELAEYLIDDINKLQGEIQLSKNRVALGRR